MKVIVDLCVVPIGVGVNLATYIAACERVLLDAGLKIQLHPNGTAIEGEWGPVFAAIEIRRWKTRWRALRRCSNNCRNGPNEKGAPCLSVSVWGSGGYGMMAGSCLWESGLDQPAALLHVARALDTLSE